jgi:alginate O-acetyltransferase complex protein AlgI
MLFNSVEFFIFLPIVFILYWFIFRNNVRAQNYLILISSYVFYGWWDYRFLLLILLSTIIDYTIGWSINRCKINTRKALLLTLSITFNLGLLMYFKYVNFFIESWVTALTSLGYDGVNVRSLNVLLPVGISFYTFQTMSYSIDIYKGQLKPVRDFVSFAAFVSFFPQLVAGPIERASNLLPQVVSKRSFNYRQGVQGLRLILWGLVKKVVVADSLSPIVDNIFENYQDLNGGMLWLGAFYFAFQIYCDFSGYSDIAIGISKLFGFNLMSNFKFPYFSRNIGEFWRRWHISLSSWFRDYLYIPLGGSREGYVKSIFNIFVIFLVSGFWHGANWTFIVWGVYHAFLFIPSFIKSRNRAYSTSVIAENGFFQTFREMSQVLFTIFLVTIGWVFFRSETIVDSFGYLHKMFFNFNFPDENRLNMLYIVVLMIFDYRFRRTEQEVLNFSNMYLRYTIYIIMTLMVLKGIIVNDNDEFIYFQF